LRYAQSEQSTAAIVADILRVAFPDARTALDLTPGHGNFWNGSAHVEVTNYLGDFCHVERPNQSVDVVAIDPPHIADGGKHSIMARRFGTATAAQLEELVMQGVAEAWRVARLGFFAKVCDHTHGQRLVLETDWVRRAMGGWLPYDVVHQVRRRSMRDPRWGTQLSAYSNGATYLIFRRGDQRHVRRAQACTEVPMS
jgi:hypothetical protein